ncbi:PREDICTED: F-box/kelch-repeat protein At3g23880-like [Nicotiana attenuata]|uniref:F-box protein cpr30 n=1 Tax=Nicotiana attenuata TaxID=49451 RepID=A0A314LCD2_NICAT|nr:PREDICTED: F-box/kelch-repeat protein At3g23880-like [Nicotiana attenuata]OIT39252.1 f-box protein cpr30 [Nicotiana attenuata]
MNSDQFGQETMFCSFLPRDIVIEILLRLPVKSLLRFKSVSKPFCSLIKNPNFISKHIGKTTQEKPPHLLIMGRHHKTLEVKVRLIHSLTKPSHIPPLHFDVPFGLTSEKTRIVGSANGLICLNLVNHNGVAIVIWNPATKTFKPVTRSPYVSTLCKLSVTDLGFGYHPGNDDYMVVRLLNVATSRRKYEVEVYTLSTNSWRKIASDGRVLLVILPFWKPMAPGMVVVKGVIYWVGVEVRNEEMCSVVVSLEMSSDELNFISPPIEHHGIVVDLREAITLRLFNLNESLALIYSENLEKVDIWMNAGFDIWLLNENDVERTWSRRFKVEPSQGLLLEAGFWENSKALVAEERKEMCFDENREYVYTKGETKLYLYDIIKGDVEIIENHELRAPFQAYSYLESLVDVKGGVNVAKEADLSKLLDFDPLLF